jgi:LysM repeat protein
MDIYIPQMSMGGANSQADSQTYTVQPGDTLESIASRFGVELSQLIAENFKDAFTGPLQAGQELRIPAGENVQGFLLYTAQEGDTPDSIAQKFDIALSDLLRANPHLANKFLSAGSTVKVPQFATPGQDNQLPQTYTMKLGDSLAEIAKRHNISLDKLQQANPQIANPNKSYPGEVVKFPQAHSSNPESGERKAMEENSSVRSFAFDNLSKIRFQMIERQQMPENSPVPTFGVPQQTAIDGEESEPAKLGKGKPAIPTPFDEWAPFIYSAAEKYRIEASLIAAIIWRESGGNNIIKGHRHGLMQIDGRRYRDWLGEHRQGLDPASNIDFGTSILRSLIDRFKGNIKSALAALNDKAEANYALDVLSQQEYFRRFFED